MRVCGCCVFVRVCVRVYASGAYFDAVLSRSSEITCVRVCVWHVCVLGNSLMLSLSRRSESDCVCQHVCVLTKCCSDCTLRVSQI